MVIHQPLPPSIPQRAPLDDRKQTVIWHFLLISIISIRSLCGWTVAWQGSEKRLQQWPLVDNTSCQELPISLARGMETKTDSLSLRAYHTQEYLTLCFSVRAVIHRKKNKSANISLKTSWLLLIMMKINLK